MMKRQFANFHILFDCQSRLMHELWGEPPEPGIGLHHVQQVARQGADVAGLNAVAGHLFFHHSQRHSGFLG
jgi:hypothetical protein